MNNQGSKAAQKGNKKFPENKLKDMEMCYLHDREFKIAVLKKTLHDARRQRQIFC